MSELEPSTFLTSPAKHVSRVCSFLDKALDGDGVILVHSPQGHNRAMLIGSIFLIHRYSWSVELAMEVTSLSRRTRMKGSFVSGLRKHAGVMSRLVQTPRLLQESFTLHNTSFNQAVRLAQSAPSARTAPKVKFPRSLAPCVVKPKSSSSPKRPQTSEPTRGTEPAGSILRSGDARRHRTPLKLAKTSALLSRVARPLTSACRSYTPLGLDVPQIDVRNVPAQFLGHATILELMEAGHRNCQLFGQSSKTPSDGKDRPCTAPKASSEPLHRPSTSLDRNTPSPKKNPKSVSTTPERHARPPTLTQVSSAASLDSLASSSRVDSPSCATNEESESVIELNPTPLSLRTDQHFLPLFSPPPHTPPSAADSNTDRSRPSSPTLTNPLSPPKDPASVNEPPSPVLVTLHPFSRGNAVHSPQHSKPAPKLVPLPTTPPPLPQNTAACILRV
ncbi:hypothetical protein BLNAU_13836 [Blattamonas nauphoetae]|uniref:Tyrosine specific protein phosphatases domain-containing protein n=1 Tax=Blattamonas nauphoetae TaxID=2049346 RepID=A0ABQ9XM51_9EUKA|nr:hypothetical protein BLNAU_13836 [Blattamonas nauphoetae]